MSIFRKITIIYGFKDESVVKDIEEELLRAAKKLDAGALSTLYELHLSEWSKNLKDFVTVQDKS